MSHFCNIFTLGRLGIERDGVPLETQIPRKSRALLVYLAYHQGPQPREQLADLLWSNQDQQRAAGSLRMAITGLREQFDSLLDISRYQIELKETWLDAAALHQVIHPMRPHLERLTPEQTGQIEQAVRWYQGDFLQGFYVTGADGFEEWMLRIRAQLRQDVTDGLAALVGWHLAHGSAQEGLRHGLNLLQIDSLREDAHRQVMRLYIKLGERGAALKQYEICQTALHNELSVEPDDETTELAAQIRAGTLKLPEPAKPARPKTRTPKLPIPPTPFIGRQAELAQIANLLADSHCRLLTLVGVGGIGKTRLALQAATLQAEQGVDVYFVSLASIDTPDMLLSALASGLEIPVRQQGDIREQMLHFLESRQMLAVLDNFEHLLEAADLLGDILTRAPGIRMLVTSREPLHLQQEWLLRLEGMRVPVKEDEALMSYPAVELFLQNARRIRSEMQLTDRAALLTICQALEGLPLALELAASWVQMLSLTQIAQQVAGGLDFLTTTTRNIPQRHRSLRMVFEGSWQPLSGIEREVLMRLSVFRGGFTLEAAGAVAGASLPALAALIEKSLVRSDPNGRYDMHELLRQYAAEKLTEAGLVADTHQRMLRYYIALSIETAPKIISADQRTWLSYLSREIRNIRVALGWGLENAPYEALDMAGQLFWFWQISVWYAREGLQWLTALIDKAGPMRTDTVWARGLFAASGLAWWEHDYARSRYWIELSVEMWEQIGDTEGIGFVYMGKGMVLMSHGELAEAKAAFERSIECQRQAGQKWGLAMSLNGLGEVGLAMGSTEIDQQFLQEAIQFAREAGSEWLITVPMLNSVLTRQQGYSAGAETTRMHYGSDQAFLGTSLCHLAKVLLRQGQADRAAGLFRESLQIYHKVRHRPGMAVCVEGLAMVAAVEENHQCSIRLFAAAEALRAASQITLAPNEQADHDRLLAHVREQFPAAQAAEIWQQGYGSSLDEVLDFALAERN